MSNGGPISWQSKKMSCIALSSTEAEFHALCLAGREIVWLRRLFLRDLGHSPEDLTVSAYGNLALEAYSGDRPPPRPIPIMEDNTGCIAMCKNTGIRHSRSKHIELKWFWVRQMTQAGIILPVYVPSKENLADILTKPVTKEVLEYLRPRLLWPQEEPRSQDDSSNPAQERSAS